MEQLILDLLLEVFVPIVGSLLSLGVWILLVAGLLGLSLLAGIAEKLGFVVTGDGERKRRVTLRVPGWFRRATLALGVISGLALIGVVAFSSSLLRLAVSQLDGSGVSISYRDGDVDLFHGDLWFEGLRVRRSADPELSFDVTLARVEVDLDLDTLKSERVRFERVALRGCTGEMRIVRGLPSAEAEEERDFDLDRLELSEIMLTVHLRHEGRSEEPLYGPIGVTHFESRGLSGTRWLAPLLFDGRGAGEAFGAELKTVPVEDTFEWHIRNLPLSGLAHVMPELSFLRAGWLDAVIKVRPEGDERVLLGCRVTVRALQVVAEPDAGPVRRAMAALLTRYLERKGQVELRFPMELDRSELDGESALSGSALTTRFAAAIALELARALKMKAAQISKLGASMRDRARALRRRVTGKGSGS